MKSKFILLLILQFVFCFGFSQSGYIGVRAKYIDTRLVDNSPHASTRENRLILFFYDVSPSGVYTPLSLTDFDLYIYKSGLQYGSYSGGVLDSTGNNYPGYAYTAPMAVSYYNSLYPDRIDCDPNLTTHYIVNGQFLDCGFIPVSYWETDGLDEEAERFTAPNICLPFYVYPDSLAMFPGNVNFQWPVFPTEPYNWYSFVCTGGYPDVVIRGVLPSDTSGLGVLPVRFDNESVSINDNCIARLKFSNLTESDINYYSVERSVNGSAFQQAGIIFPLSNNNNQADYEFPDNLQNIPGTLLYRIIAIENSGRHFYSATLKVKGCSKPTILTVYPNPVLTAQFTFKFTDLPYGHYDVLLMNVEGQLTKLKELDHAGGPVTQYIDLHYVPSGIYVLIIRSNQIQFSQKLIITN